MNDPSGHAPGLIMNSKVFQKRAIKAGVRAAAAKKAAAPTKTTSAKTTAIASSSSSPIANHVTKSHVTSFAPIFDIPFIGGVGVSSTFTTPHEKPAFLNSYTDTGINPSTSAVGVGISDWFGVGGGYSREGNVFVGLQVTPWFHGSVSVGLEGVGVSVGYDDDNTAYDIEVKAGWGLIPVLFGIHYFGGSLSYA